MFVFLFHILQKKWVIETQFRGLSLQNDSGKQTVYNKMKPRELNKAKQSIAFLGELQCTKLLRQIPFEKIL